MRPALPTLTMLSSGSRTDNDRLNIPIKLERLAGHGGLIQHCSSIIESVRKNSGLISGFGIFLLRAQVKQAQLAYGAFARRMCDTMKVTGSISGNTCFSSISISDRLS